MQSHCSEHLSLVPLWPCTCMLRVLFVACVGQYIVYSVYIHVIHVHVSCLFREKQRAVFLSYRHIGDSPCQDLLASGPETECFCSVQKKNKSKPCFSHWHIAAKYCVSSIDYN
jgi:hypothetical protein